MKHSIRYYFYKLSSCWIIVVFGYLFFAFIIILQFSHIKSQERRIMHLNNQLIHIQTCQEAMQAVYRLEEINQELKDRKKESYRDNFYR